MSPSKKMAEGYAKPYNGLVLYTVVNLENPLVTDSNQANTGITLENNDGAIVSLGEDTLGLAEEAYDPNEVVEVVLKKADQIQILSEEESRQIDQINAEYEKALAALESTTIEEETTTTTDPRVADIERRKKQSLSETEWSKSTLFGAYLRQESDGRWTSYYFKPSAKGMSAALGITRDTKEEVIAELEKRYAEELAALKEQPADIENDEYNNFIDNGVVTKERIQSIADKVKNNEQLTPREMEIFSDKTSEINAEIASQMPTEETNDETVADLRAQEQVELRKAIPNIDDYPDTYGEKQGNMPGVLYGIYKVIYDKYDKLITDASGTKPKSKGRVKVKAFRTSNTFSSRVGFAQRGAGVYYGLDKPFVELFGESGEVSEVEVEYDPSKTLDALTSEGQAEFMKIKSSAVGNKTFTSIREMNQAVSTAMLDAGYESLIGNITEDKPEDGRELVIYTKPEEVNEENVNQAEINKLTQEYEAAVAKRKTYYNSLRQKVGKVSQDRYLNNLKIEEDKELASIKEIYEQFLERLGVQRSPETQLENISKMNLPESVLNLRESIAKADRVQLSTIEANIKPLIELGIADVVLKQQNLTRDEVNDLIKNARARLKGTLAHSELANTMRLRKPLEERVVYYDTEKGTQAGVLVSFDNNAVFVAPYTGKEGMSDLQDKSKWVTFTVSEIPYKLFYAKTTAPVTATPDITQQSDDLVKDGEANKTAVDDFKNDISNDDFKDQSANDAANDLFDDLNNCTKPVKPE